MSNITPEISRLVGYLACAGAFALAFLVGLAGRLIISQRSRPPHSGNPAVQPYDSPATGEDDFGGVPTTGPVQEYERDSPEQVIGSSGFDIQAYYGEDEEDLTK